MNISNFKLENYKKSVIFSLFFILVVISFYFFVLDKIFYIFETKETLEKEKLHFLSVRRENYRVDKKNKVLKKQLENLEEITKKNNLKKKYSFKNINSVEIFVENYIRKNFLHLIAIGRCEKDDKTEKIYFPYIIQGELKNLLSFIKEIESSAMDISFGETSFIFKIDKESTFEGKIKSTINEFINENDENNFKNLARKFSEKRIEKIKILNFNNKNYIILRYADGTNCVLEKEKEVIINGKKYKVKIDNENKVYLE